MKNNFNLVVRVWFYDKPSKYYHFGTLKGVSGFIETMLRCGDVEEIQLVKAAEWREDIDFNSLSGVSND